MGPKQKWRKPHKSSISDAERLAPNDIYNNGQLVATKFQVCITISCAFRKFEGPFSRLKIKADARILRLLKMSDVVKKCKREGPKDIYVCLGHFHREGRPIVSDFLRTKQLPDPVQIRSSDATKYTLGTYWKKQAMLIQPVPVEVSI